MLNNLLKCKEELTNYLSVCLDKLYLSKEACSSNEKLLNELSVEWINFSLAHLNQTIKLISKQSQSQRVKNNENQILEEIIFLREKVDKALYGHSNSSFYTLKNGMRVTIFKN